MGGREESGWEEERKWVSEVSLIPLLIFSSHEKEPGYKTREIGRESKPNRSKEMLSICSNPKVAFMESNFLMHVAQCMGECSHGVSDPQAIQVWLFLASGSLLFIFSSLYFM